MNMSMSHAHLAGLAIISAIALLPAIARADAGDACSECDVTTQTDAEAAYTVVPEAGIGDTGHGCTASPAPAGALITVTVAAALLLSDRRRGEV